MECTSQGSPEHGLPNSGNSVPTDLDPSQRLQKSRRLLKRAQFQEVMAAGRKAVTPCLIVMAKPQEHPQPSRLGIIASKKVGNAVMRNRAKRRIRESFRQLNQDLCKDLAGWDFVVIARQQASVFEAAVVDYHLSRALAKAIRPSKPTGTKKKPRPQQKRPSQKEREKK